MSSSKPEPAPTDAAAAAAPSAADGAAHADGEEAVAAKPTPKFDANKDLWENIGLNVKDNILETAETTVLVCGASSSGKTSIIQRMLKAAADDKPKATTALEYCYGKREERNVTQIVHFWELAHDADLAQLSEVVLTPENIHQAMAIIVVDCGSPQTAWATVTDWLKRIDRRISEIFEKMRAKQSSTPDKLMARARKRLGGDEHPDMERLRVLGIPVVIIASRIDKMGNDTVKMKLMVKTMRYLAHLYGAALCFTSKQDREVNKMRALLNHMIFEAPFDMSHMLTDSDKGGVLVPSGRDTFLEIGDPAPTESSSSFVPSGDATLDRWKAPFDEAFPPRTAERKSEDADFQAKLFDAEHGFGEVAVDQMRKLKDTELEQYRRSAAKKASDSRKDKGGGGGDD